MSEKLRVSSDEAERERRATFRPLEETIRDTVARYQDRGMFARGRGLGAP